MKSIVSIVTAAVLLLSALTACGANGRTRADEARTTPNTTVTQTARPAVTTQPEGLGDKVGDAARNAGDMAGNAVEDVGNAAGNAMEGAGRAMDDLFNGDDNTRNDAANQENRTNTNR